MGSERVTFKTADGVALKDDFFRAGSSSSPGVVMAQGLSLLKEHYIEDTARRFQEAGISALVYDHRGYGSSGGHPRHQTDPLQQAKAIAALYAEDALFESASVLALWPEHGSGIVRGRPEIERFFAGVFELNKDVFAEWYRTGTYFTDGRVLIWEYPRQTPGGQQAGLVESMDLDDSGQITAHRVYWGWLGVSSLIEKSLRKTT